MSEANKVAIVGMSGRFPGAPDIDSLWRSLLRGEELIQRFDDVELIEAGVDKARLSDPNYVRARPLLGDVSLFDAGFFGMKPRDAALTDPQLRLLLECAWEALEQSGYAGDHYGGSVGVFAGVRQSRYLEDHLLANPQLVEAVGRDYLQMINRKDSAATLLAYHLNLKGPAVSLNTACSTSLVAVHLAVSSLLNFECDVAIAGGAAIPAFDKEGYIAPAASAWSPDGHCRAFDAAGRGTLDGSGGAMVALRRLEDAIADGDVIHGVILGTAINNDGARKVGYAAPSVEGQAQVIAETMVVAGVTGDDIGYVEAHGTATPLGDPIEIAALTKAYRLSSTRIGDCPIGSIKTNVGHLGAAAGVTGLIKAVLCVKHGQIPASLHFEKPNDSIDFQNSPFFVNDRLRPWPSGGDSRRAAVSSFGIGGTNAHLILEQAPIAAAAGSHRRFQLLPIATMSPAATLQAARRLAEHLERESELSLPAVAATLRSRAGLPDRTAVVADDVRGAIGALRGIAPSSVAVESARRVGFLFSGQGSQRLGMAKKLYRHEPTFRRAFDRCATFLRWAHGIDVEDLIWACGPDDAAAERLDRTEYAQPALFVVEWAMCELWQSFGIAPAAMCGHSLGEYVAACRAGVFELEQALSLVVARGRAMERAPRGGMLAVAAGEDEALALLKDGLDLAAVNGPSSCVLSGTNEAIARLRDACDQRRIAWRLLRTSHAYHSFLMEPAIEEFARALDGVRFAEPTIPFISNVTGDWIAASQATDPGYWIGQVRSPVRFFDGVRQLAADAPILLGIGPDAALANLARAVPGVAAALASCDPRGDTPDDLALLSAVGRLWELGVDIDWRKFTRDESARQVALPGYPFERRSHWIDVIARPAPAGWRPNVETPQPHADNLFVGIGKRSAGLVQSLSHEGSGHLDRDDVSRPPAAVLVDDDSSPSDLAAAQRAAAAADIPLVLVAATAPCPVSPDTLVLDPPAAFPRLEHLVAMLSAAAGLGYRRIALNAEKIQPSSAVAPAVSEDVEPAMPSPDEDMTRQICSIWSAVFGVAAIRPDDNFFDLGGDSLLALQVIGRINHAFGSTIKAPELVAAPTARALSARVETNLLASIDVNELDSMLTELTTVKI
jgi:acyl transferase domain-containing protein/acyl carrier protein